MSLFPFLRRNPPMWAWIVLPTLGFVVGRAV